MSLAPLSNSRAPSSGILPRFFDEDGLIEEFAFMLPSCTRGDAVDLLVLYLRDDVKFISFLFQFVAADTSYHVQNIQVRKI